MTSLDAPTKTSEIVSLEMCYRIADKKSDENDDLSARAINFAAYTAQMYRRNLKRLAWACIERNFHKRDTVLQVVLAELLNNGESIADLPAREGRLDE